MSEYIAFMKAVQEEEGATNYDDFTDGERLSVYSEERKDVVLYDDEEEENSSPASRIEEVPK